MEFCRGVMCILIAALLVLSRAGAQDNDIVTFMPHWLPQAQFAGYFIAYEKGFYTRNGINVKILTGGSGKVPADHLQSGKATVASMWLADAIKKKTKGVPLSHLAQVEQKSALMLIAKRKSGITTPHDINHRSVGLWDGQFQLQPRALFKKFGLHVTVVTQSNSINLFLRDGVDVISAMWYNEYHSIINAGVNPDELTTFFFFDYGLNFPEAGLYTMEGTLMADSARISAFVRASIEGWNYAFAHQDDALSIVLEYMNKAHVPASRVHQKWMLQRMNDLITGGTGKIQNTVLTSSDYHRVADALKNSGMIDTVPAYESFFRGYGEWKNTQEGSRSNSVLQCFLAQR